MALARWAAESGVAAVRSRNRSLLSDDALAGLITAFIERRAATGSANQDTLRIIEGHLRRYVVDFFVVEKGQKDVRDWWRHTEEFTTWLRATHAYLTVETARKICHNLRAFGEFLASKQVTPQPWLIDIPRKRRGERTATPLKRQLSPSDIMQVATKLPPPWALFVLLGYFASLRPGEIFGLDLGDFITGNKAKQEAKTYLRFAKAGLGSGLSIAVRRSRGRGGVVSQLKTDSSFGVVNVWSVEGAHCIAQLLKAEARGLLYGDARREALDAQFLEIVKPLLDVQEYDLRRASGYYLGRVLGVEPFLLQDHMRHASLSTTLLYTRRPEQEVEVATTQDWDDVS